MEKCGRRRGQVDGGGVVVNIVIVIPRKFYSSKISRYTLRVLANNIYVFVAIVCMFYIIFRS